jgi:hypothetical protein
MQPPTDVIDHLLMRGRWSVEQQHAADVHVRAAVLLMQEAGIGGRQPIEVLLCHRDAVKEYACRGGMGLLN